MPTDFKKMTNFSSFMDSSVIRLGATNATLRLLIAASQFVFLFFFVKLCPADKVGIYGLVGATITLSMFVVGLEFYNYVTREVIAASVRKRARMLRDQALFQLLIYGLCLPALCSVFFAGLLPWSTIVWFYVLLIFEHVTQEFHRWLIALSQPLKATILVFFRSAFWKYLWVVWALSRPGELSLTSIWIAWTVGDLMALFLAVLWVVIPHKTGFWEESIDWEWIKQGIKVSLPFFLASVALWGCFTIDRYVLKWYHGEADVGIYTFFTGIARIVAVAADAGVFLILLPKIILAYQTGSTADYRKYLKNMILGVLVTVGFCTLAILVGIGPLLGLVAKTEYVQNQHLIKPILAAMGVYCLGLIPYSVLYSKKRDKAIVAASLIAFFISIAANLALVPRHGGAGAAYATLLSMSGFALFSIAANIWRTDSPSVQSGKSM